MDTSTSTDPVLSQPKAKLVSVRQLFSDTFALFGKEWDLLLGIYCSVLIPYFVLVAIVGAFVVRNDQSAVSIEYLFVLVLLFMYFLAWAYAAMIQVNHATAESRPSSVREAFKATLSRVWPLLGTFGLLFLAVLGGSILLIVPGIIFAMWFSLAAFVSVLEGAGPADSLKRSKNYTKGHRWAIFGRMVAFGLVAGLVQFVVLALLTLAIGSLPHAVSLAWSFVFNFFELSLFLIYGYEMYRSLKDRYVEPAA